MASEEVAVSVELHFLLSCSSYTGATGVSCIRTLIVTSSRITGLLHRLFFNTAVVPATICGARTVGLNQSDGRGIDGPACYPLAHGLWRRAQ